MAACLCQHGLEQLYNKQQQHAWTLQLMLCRLCPPHGAITTTADVLINARAAVQLCSVLPVVRGRIILGLEVLQGTWATMQFLTCADSLQNCSQAFLASRQDSKKAQRPFLRLTDLREKLPLLLIWAVSITQEKVIRKLFPMARQQSRSSHSPAIICGSTGCAVQEDSATPPEARIQGHSRDRASSHVSPVYCATAVCIDLHEKLHQLLVSDALPQVRCHLFFESCHVKLPCSFLVSGLKAAGRLYGSHSEE